MQQRRGTLSFAAAHDMKSRLAAVAFADVVGYTTLVHLNLPATMAAWQGLRSEVIGPRLERSGGALVDRAGDGLFVEFPSATTAVSWALDVQENIPTWRADRPDPKLSLRIGIDVEDVLLDDEDKPVGEGISIAARIQSLAEPDHVVITGAVRELVLGKLPLRFFARGPRQLRNVSRRTQVYRVERDPAGTIDLRDYPATPDWSMSPTIAVLPFIEMGAEGENVYLGAGVGGEIVDLLDRTRSVVVISSASTWRYANRSHTGNAAAELARIGSELGVRYLLDGTVERRGGHLLIRSELIDAETGRRVWAGKMQGSAEKIFEFPEQIARSIVGSLEPHLLRSEAERTRGRRTEDLDAYDCVLHGMSLLYRLDATSFERAGRLFQRAVALDPNFARGYAYLAWWHNFNVGEERSDGRQKDTSSAQKCAEQALGLDPEDPFALAVAGHIHAFLKQDSDTAVELFNRALEFSPCSAFAWGVSAPAYTYRGRPDIAIERAQTAEAFSPRDPMAFKYRTSEGIAWFVAGDNQKAIQLLKLARIDNRRYNACNRVLAAALALEGLSNEAHGVVSEYLEAHPHFSVSQFEKWYPLQPDAMSRLAKGLRLAGMPE